MVIDEHGSTIIGEVDPRDVDALLATRKPAAVWYPVLFQPQLVRAILRAENPKTQTRRLISPQPGGKRYLGVVDRDRGPKHWFSAGGSDKSSTERYCPYGKAGDLLWVREPWRTLKSFDQLSPNEIGAEAVKAGYPSPWAPVEYLADHNRVNFDAISTAASSELGRYRHGRFMPRWLSRIALRVADVRVQRLQDITAEDAKAEGVPYYVGGHGVVSEDELRIEPGYWHGIDGYRGGFEYTWGEINGWPGEPKARCPWASNPWVWAITFALHEIKR